MKPARAFAAVVTAVFTAAVGWLLLDLWSGQGGRTPPQSFVAAVAILVVAAVVLVLGWEVRRSVRGERKPAMNPLAAARVAVLSKAAVYGGAVLTGWYAAIGLSLLDDATGVRRERLLTAAAAAVASAALIGRGTARAALVSAAAGRRQPGGARRGRRPRRPAATPGALAGAGGVLRGGDCRTAPQGRVHVRRGEHAGERAVVVEDGQGGLVEAGQSRESLPQGGAEPDGRHPFDQAAVAR